MAAKAKTTESKELADRQLAFAKAYAVCLNVTKAAITAGYSPITAYSQGSRLKADPKVRAAINVLIAGRGLDKNEMLARLEMIAEDSNTLEQIVVVRKEKQLVGRGENAKEVEVEVALPDLKAALKSGVLRSAKKVKVDRFGCVSIEMHDPLRAMELTAKLKGYLEEDSHQDDDETDDEKAMESGDLAVENALETGG